MKNNIYTGKYDDDYIVLLNGKPFDPAPSLKLANHSPDGFSFGYYGSGPAQLALGILLEETGRPEEALELSMIYKDEVIARLPKAGWTLTSEDVESWLGSMDR